MSINTNKTKLWDSSIFITGNHLAWQSVGDQRYFLCQIKIFKLIKVESFQILLKERDRPFWPFANYVSNKLEHVQATKRDPNFSIFKIDYRNKYMQL